MVCHVVKCRQSCRLFYSFGLEPCAFCLVPPVLPVPGIVPGSMPALSLSNGSKDVPYAFSLRPRKILTFLFLYQVCYVLSVFRRYVDKLNTHTECCSIVNVKEI